MEPDPILPSISYEDFSKVCLQVGTILTIEDVPKSRKLVRMTVDLGEPTPRTVVAGILVEGVHPGHHVGKQYLFVTNLAPVKLMGIESQAMLLAAKSGESLSLLVPVLPTVAGSRAK